MVTKYSVVLLYPDYLADNYPEETYLAWVTAETPRAAAAAARKEVVDAYVNEFGDDDPPDPIDFSVVFLCPGWVSNYSEFHDRPVGSEA